MIIVMENDKKCGNCIYWWQERKTKNSLGNVVAPCMHKRHGDNSKTDNFPACNDWEKDTIG